MHTSLLQAIEDHAARRPRHAALVDPKRTLSYAELANETRRWTSALVARGLEPGMRLGIALRDDSRHVVAMLAAAQLGVTIVPLDWRAPAADTHRLARRFSASMILVESARYATDDPATIVADNDWNAEVAGASGYSRQHATADTPLIIKLSSGTTGMPSGAIVTHRQVVARLMINESSFGPMAGDTYLSVSPLYFGAGSQYCKLHLYFGNTVVLYPPLFSADEYVDAVRNYGATFLFVVPTVLHRLLELEPRDGPLLADVRILLCGGAAFGPDRKREVAKRICPNFHEVYATSAAGQITLLRPGDLDTHADSAGRPVDGIDVEIVDARDEPRPRGSVGRLRCRGDAVSGEFFGEADAPGNSTGWYYSGDLASLDEDGFLKIEGRSDDVIIRAGINIYPSVVEDALRRHPAVADAALVGRACQEFGQRAVACVILRTDTDDDALLAHCRAELSATLLPDEFVRFDEFPTTTSGKVLRRKLLPD